MLDLSYLTAEERETILAVLKRDAELKQAEEQRVRKLQKTLQDRSKLKYMTGEWFYETKSRRHRDKVHGSDIIKASLVPKKPVTLLELTQMWEGNPSFVNSKNREVFVPAELSGLIEERPSRPKEERKKSCLLSEGSSDTRPVAALGAVQQRQNPFNSPQLGLGVLHESDDHLTDGAVDAPEGDKFGCHVEPLGPQSYNLHHSLVGTGHGEDPKHGKLATRPAASRPKSFSKSLEDITSLPAREHDTSSVSLDRPASKVPSLPASSFLDPEQMKNMSKSVPTFLQEENGRRDDDSTSVNSIQSGVPNGSDGSFTNLSGISGMASASSVSGSIMSVYSGDFGSVDIKGTIRLAISYVPKLSEFHIFVVQCRDLAVADPKRNRSDPYVKSYLLPDKAKMGKRKTSVKKRTLNPTYNEILRYRVDIETLKTQTLNLSVWHHDSLGQNSFLGEVDVDLSKWDFSNMQMNDFPLKPRSASSQQPLDYRGEMRLALCYLPQVSQGKKPSQMGKVQVCVKDCKDLPKIRGAVIDPFVKCTVLPDTSKKSHQKTRVLKGTSCPVFHHTMVYDGFRPEDLREVCVELTVWDHERLSNNFLGGLRLGFGKGTSYGTVVEWMDSNSHEVNLWKRMMTHHNEWVEDVVPLRMLMMARSMSK